MSRLHDVKIADLGVVHDFSTSNHGVAHAVSTDVRFAYFKTA
jgi:lipoate-protein ligase B